ncbi:hypothetical protein IWW36_001189 [Coemansia brasiliensis]|uniref:RRM domain-containing protein n=1 Tax=Coemansia brasiliensis TaxID=2650707 RepID=A0A9W8M112_9FUNG|nr:hypothetical protein IWW36_001189 [Coemansia brasiliensis]
MSPDISNDRADQMDIRSRSISPERDSYANDGYSPPPLNGDYNNGQRRSSRGPRSRERSYSRSRSFSRSPRRDRSRSFSRSLSRSPSRSRSRSFSRSPSPGYSLSRSPSPRRYTRRSISRDRSRNRSPGPASKPMSAGELRSRRYDTEPFITITNLTQKVRTAHLREILHEFGPTLKVRLSMYTRRSNKERNGFAFFDKQEDLQKAIDYLDGGEIDGQKVSVFIGDEKDRNIAADRRQGKNSGRNRRDRNRKQRGGAGRRRGRRGRSPSFKRGSSGRRGRSPSPRYRSRGRYSRYDRYSPARSRSPYDRYRRYSRSRYYSRSPSPEHGGYRGRRYSRSRSISPRRRRYY